VETPKVVSNQEK